MDEAPVTHVFTVRNRPVGFRPSRFGGELVATERGYFPVNSSGYRSLAGQFGGRPGTHEMIGPDFLEALAENQDRERTQLLKQLRDASKPVGHPVANFVHVSVAFEKAVQDGFFAGDRDRTALWSGAHQLLCLVETNPRYQPAPAPGFPAWDEKHCAQSYKRSLELLALLKQLAAGEMPRQFPTRLLGASAYFRLPPKPGGEPQIALGAFASEMRLDVPSTATSQPKRSVPPPNLPLPSQSAGIQLGLFDSVPSLRSAEREGSPRIFGP